MNGRVIRRMMMDTELATSVQLKNVDRPSRRRRVGYWLAAFVE